MSPLCQQIREHVKNHTQRGLIGSRVYVYDDCPSTNSLALSMAQQSEEEGALIIARSQSHGRGRLGRNWVSDEGNLALSFFLRPTISVAKLARYTIMTAVAVAKTLEQLRYSPAIKWPNDIILHSEGRPYKVGGILCESLSSQNAIECVIIGIGLNIISAPSTTDSDIAAGSLSDWAKVDYLDVLVGVVNNLNELLPFVAQDALFVDLLSEYKKRCCTIGAPLSSSLQLSGAIGADILDDGALLAQLSDGSQRVLYSAG